MRSDAKPGDVIKAVVKAIEATFDRSRWMELGLETDSLDYIRGHRRLLRSLDWGDPDYLACVIEAVPVVLGKTRDHDFPGSGTMFKNLAIVEDFINLPAWLREHDPALYQALYAGEDAAVLDQLQEVAKVLGLEDIDAHAARIRRGLRDDPAQAIGSSKELLETVLKAVLGLHGNAPETRVDVPKLVKMAGQQLGLDPAGQRGGEPGAEQRRKLLGALTTIVTAAAELRNAGFGTGHGGTRRPALDVATARLVVSSAVAAATFYMEAYAVHDSPT